MKQMDWTRVGRQVLLAAAATAAAGFILCCLVGLLVSKEVLPVDGGRGAVVALVNGVLLLACFLTARQSPQSRLPVSMAVAAVFWVICLLIKAVAFSAWELSPGWTMALPPVAAAAAGLLASRRKTRRR